VVLLLADFVANNEGIYTASDGCMWGMYPCELGCNLLQLQQQEWRPLEKLFESRGLAEFGLEVGCWFYTAAEAAEQNSFEAVRTPALSCYRW
jgi:hypothetical protein